MDKLTVMVAPNGARRKQADHPALPITPAELATCAKACQMAGANAFHLHVREDDQTHSLSVTRYRAAMAAIRALCPDLAIQCTTESAGLFDVETQIAMVKALRPDWVSFSLAEMMRDGPEKGLGFIDWAVVQGVRVQFILYAPEEISALARLRKAGHVTRPELILVAGRYGFEHQDSLARFDTLYRRLVAEGLEDTDWMTCAFGRTEIACLERAMALGSHARVGFENAIAEADGSLCLDNADRVRQVVDAARALGRIA